MEKKNVNPYLNRAAADFDYSCLCLCNFLNDEDLRTKILGFRAEICTDVLRFLDKDTNNENTK